MQSDKTNLETVLDQAVKAFAASSDHKLSMMPVVEAKRCKGQAAFVKSAAPALQGVELDCPRTRNWMRTLFLGLRDSKTHLVSPRLDCPANSLMVTHWLG